MKKLFLLFLLSGCGVTPPPEAPSTLALKSPPPTTILTYRVHDDAGDTTRKIGEDSPLGLGFVHPRSEDKLDVESCTKDRCTLIYLPKGGKTVWLDVDRKTRRPTSMQWIGENDSIESCDIAFDKDGSAIASATCTHIVHGVGSQTRTWTLVDKQTDSRGLARVE